MSHSHPGIDAFFVILSILADFCRMPSHSASIAPPRRQLVSMRGRSRYPVTSMLSVVSPVTSTVMWVSAVRISSADGLYWSLTFLLYSSASSMNRSISSGVILKGDRCSFWLT